MADIPATPVAVMAEAIAKSILRGTTWRRAAPRERGRGASGASAMRNLLVPADGRDGNTFDRGVFYVRGTEDIMSKIRVVAWLAWLMAMAWLTRSAEPVAEPVRERAR